MASPDNARYGAMAVATPTPPASIDAGPPNVAEAGRMLYTWRPSNLIAAHLPEDFAFAMTGATGPDGIRLFRLCRGWHADRHYAWLGGLAILSHLKGVSAEVRQSERVMYLLYVRSLNTRLRLRRQFQWSRDLFIRGSRLRDERNILPADIGQDADGNGRPWSVSDLTARGREAAMQAGLRNPSPKQRVQYGLFAAAQRRPLSLPEDQVPGAVRAALYEGTATDAISPELRAEITARILAAIEAHVADSTEDFRIWLRGSESGFVNQIAKQKCRPHGAVSSEIVHSVLCNLATESLQHVSSCLSLMMQAFRNAIDPPLNERERSLFDVLYLPQLYFGGFPLFLLADRLLYLHCAIRHLAVVGPTPQAIGALHRLLVWYPEMTANRRDADRRAQQFRRATRVGSRAPREFSFDENRDFHRATRDDSDADENEAQD